MGIPIIDSILAFFQNIVTWFVNVVPDWAKVFISLFFVMFLANWLVPFFMGFGFACTTDSQLYALNSPIEGVKIMTYKLTSDVNSNESIDYTDVVNRSPEDRNIIDFIERFLPCQFPALVNSSPQCSKGQLDYWRYLYPSNYSIQSNINYNAMVAGSGTLVASPAQQGKNILVAKCSQETPGLFLFGSINLFDPTLWIIISIAIFLVPLAFKWYEINHIFGMK